MITHTVIDYIQTNDTTHVKVAQLIVTYNLRSLYIH